MQQKKTKIICTISDLNCEVGFIRSLYKNGMNVVRINTAHATIEGAQKVVDNVRAVSDKIAILIDTKGPEVRLTKMENPEGLNVKNGDIIYVYNNPEGISCQDAIYTNSHDSSPSYVWGCVCRNPVFDFFMRPYPRGMRCRGAQDPQGTRAKRRRRWRCESSCLRSQAAQLLLRSRRRR